MLKVKEGDVIEKSTVEYVQGGGTMLKGIEKVLEGCSAGDERKGVLDAKDAFGSENMPTKKLTKADFPKDAKLEPDQQFQAKGPTGQDVAFQIVSLEGDEVTVRFVHPLAGKDIEYDLKVISVTDPIPPPVPMEAIDAEIEQEGDDKK